MTTGLGTVNFGKDQGLVKTIRIGFVFILAGVLIHVLYTIGIGIWTALRVLDVVF
jgi:hypothetical protein